MQIYVDISLKIAIAKCHFHHLNFQATTVTYHFLNALAEMEKDGRSGCAAYANFSQLC